MADLTIFSIVEGHGEQTAIPVLLRRMQESIGIVIHQFAPYRLSRSSILSNDRKIKGVIELGCNKLLSSVGKKAMVFCLDTDGEVRQDIPGRICAGDQAFRNFVDAIFIIPKQEYEAWFVAAAQSLRASKRVRDDANYPLDPESIRDAKGALQQHLIKPGYYYAETVDQESFTAQMSFEEASRCASFRDIREQIIATVRR